MSTELQTDDARDIRFDLAISFAGEDRKIASRIARELTQRGYRVFYDELYELWGEDLTVYLGEIFSKRSRHCLIVLSQHYPKKPWARFESQHALAKQLQYKKYVFLLRLDDTPLEGYPSTYAYLRYTDIETTVTRLDQMLKQESLSAERARLRERLHSLTKEILLYEGYVNGLRLSEISPGDQGSRDEPSKLARLRQDYYQCVVEYSEKHGEYYDPLSVLEK